jgi:small subunit ribosomal protein S6
MREYETTVIIQPEISDEGVESLCQRLDTIIEKADGIRLMYDDQGRRRLAYEIQNFQKGRYLMLHFLQTGEVVPAIERALRLDDSVMRFLTVQVSEEVADIEGRKAEAAEEVRIREQKAAERAAREAEEAAARAEREAQEATAAKAAAEAAAKAAAKAAAEAAAEADKDASGEAGGDETAAAAPTDESSEAPTQEEAASEGDGKEADGDSGEKEV